MKYFGFFARIRTKLNNLVLIKGRIIMKRKILSVALILTMAVSMSACGSKNSGNKVDVSVDDVQAKLQESIKDVKSADIDADVAFDVDMSYGEEKMVLKFDANGELQFTVDEPSGHAKGEASYKMEMDSEKNEGSVKGEAYVISDGEKAEAYVTTDGSEWYKGEAQLDELISSLEDELGMSLEDALAQAEGESEEEAFDIKPTIADKTVEAEGKECYKLTTSVDKDLLASVPGMESEEISSVMAMFKELGATADLYVDVKTNLPVKVVVSVDLEMDAEASEMAGMTIKLNKCELAITAEYDKVSKIEVPSDIKDKAVEMDAMGVSKDKAAEEVLPAA